MSSLAQKIRAIYFQRFDELELEYQLHYASRLYSWNDDPEAAEKLRELRPVIVPPSTSERLKNLQAISEELAHKDFERDVNNYGLRKPYFDKYPHLLLIHSALFRIRHWYCIYGIDERDALFELLPQKEIEAMITSLRSDSAAIRILSTYAINTFYLYEKLYKQESGSQNTTHLLEIGAGYDHSNLKDLQLKIYLYTHSILGETLFYFQPILRHEEMYTQMLTEIEKILSDHFDKINLDNKFEFLVCAQICNFDTSLAEQIYQEAENSVHQEGFIVDMHNQNRNPLKQTFLMSEHRNVLYIMSQSKPLFNTQPIN